MRKLMIPVVALLVIALTPMPASAVDDVDSSRLRKAVTVGGILTHERALQRIANNNGGTRASGTPGYAASAAYVKNVLKKAGYKVTEQEFTFPFFRPLAPAVVEQVSPTPAGYEASTLDLSGSGDVTGTLVPTNDIVIPPDPEPSSTSGCEAADFPTAPAGFAIALIQRGTCFFEDKVDNAVAAGYDAVIIFNEGQAGERSVLLEGTLGELSTVPVVGLSFADGAALYAAAQAGPVTAHVATQTEYNPNATTTNIIADSPKGNKDKIVAVGAHLDSVVAGPGINDNGSGTATILEIAVQMSKLKVSPRQKVRFTFWGAEEANLLGSQHYVDTLSDAELAKIYAYLNFDMLGSPNYVRFVYDGNGDGAEDAPVGPPGSAQIEDIFAKYFAGQGLATEPTAFDGRSDYGPFIAVGIPAGGLFSGAEDIKTPEEAAIYGGTAGEAYDHCYHQACDDITNLNTAALSELGDAAAHAVFTLAKTKSGFFEDGSLRVQQRVGTTNLPHHGPTAVK